jgi:hypothetical protein
MAATDVIISQVRPCRTGIVDQRIDNEPARNRFGMNRGWRRRIRQVGLDDVYIHAVLLAKLSGKFLHWRDAPRNEDEVLALGGQLPRKLLAEAGRCTGDQCTAVIHL